MSDGVAQFLATGFVVLLVLIAFLVLASGVVAMVIFLVHLIGMLP